jgi:D-alanyl-D-alanine carboxypeptidase
MASAVGAVLLGGSARAVPPPFPMPPITWGPTPVEPTESAVRRLPRCRYRDLPAVGDPATDWATMVLDTVYRLPADYAPRRLVSTRRAGLQSGFEVIPEVIDDLRAMHQASIRAKAEIAVRWAYRSYGEQAGAFAYWVRDAGRARALQVSARPGHSEHQLGTTIDVEGGEAWLADEAWRYGFVVSYPFEHSPDTTCYKAEPWHLRYVGREAAAEVQAAGVSLRAWLWGRQAGD